MIDRADVDNMVRNLKHERGCDRSLQQSRYFKVYDLHWPVWALLSTLYGVWPNVIIVPCLWILLDILSLYPANSSLLNMYVLFRSQFWH
jgi:hypothetical protein